MEYFLPLTIVALAIVWVISSVNDIITCYKARNTYTCKWWKKLKETTQFLFVFIIFVLCCLSFVAIANM